MNGGCGRQSIERRRNPRDELLQHLVVLHDVSLRGWQSSLNSFYAAEQP
jgi:hypothetical protein